MDKTLSVGQPDISKWQLIEITALVKDSMSVA
jgi:hypothetical protein